MHPSAMRGAPLASAASPPSASRAAALAVRMRFRLRRIVSASRIFGTASPFLVRFAENNGKERLRGSFIFT